MGDFLQFRQLAGQDFGYCPRTVPDDPKEAALFFLEWRSGLRWQTLAPFEKFARMIGMHWAGIAS